VQLRVALPHVHNVHLQIDTPENVKQEKHYHRQYRATRTVPGLGGIHHPGLKRAAHLAAGAVAEAEQQEEGDDDNRSVSHGHRGCARRGSRRRLHSPERMEDCGRVEWFESVERAGVSWPAGYSPGLLSVLDSIQIP
jgi:hypothetical protein